MRLSFKIPPAVFGHVSYGHSSYMTACFRNNAYISFSPEFRNGSNFSLPALQIDRAIQHCSSMNWRTHSGSWSTQA